MQGVRKTSILSINTCIIIKIMDISMTKIKDIESVQRQSAKKKSVLKPLFKSELTCKITGLNHYFIKKRQYFEKQIYKVSNKDTMSASADIYLAKSIKVTFILENLLNTSSTLFKSISLLIIQNSKQGDNSITKNWL